MGQGMVQIQGNASILLDTAGGIDIEGGQHLIIGASTQDTFDIFADREGYVSADASAQASSGLQARISMQLATYSLAFKRNAYLNIGKNSVFEINALNNTLQSGTLTNLTFDDAGVFYLDQDGELIIGRNGLQPPNQQETPIAFSMLNGTLVGNGIVGLAGTPLFGIIQNLSIPAGQYTAQALVSALININTVTKLHCYTVFFAQDGTKRLFNNSTQTVVTLPPEATIFYDDPATCIVYGANSGVSFSILPNGLFG